MPTSPSAPNDRNGHVDLDEAMKAAEDALRNARKDGINSEVIRVFESVVERYKTLQKMRRSNESD